MPAWTVFCSVNPVAAAAEAHACGTQGNASSFQSRADMLAAGWRFTGQGQGSADRMFFVDKKGAYSTSCQEPRMSYCGFMAAGRIGTVALELSRRGAESGLATITFGNGLDNGGSTVMLYKNNELITTASRGVESVTLAVAFKHGDVLKLDESNSIIMVHSIVFNCDYVQVKDSCWSTDNALISTASGCKAAAKALGIIHLPVQFAGSLSAPKGCYTLSRPSGPSFLYFNQIGGTKTKPDEGEFALCIRKEPSIIPTATTVPLKTTLDNVAPNVVPTSTLLSIPRVTSRTPASGGTSAGPVPTAEAKSTAGSVDGGDTPPGPSNSASTPPAGTLSTATLPTGDNTDGTGPEQASAPNGTEVTATDVTSSSDDDGGSAVVPILIAAAVVGLVIICGGAFVVWRRSRQVRALQWLSTCPRLRARSAPMAGSSTFECEY